MQLPHGVFLKVLRAMQMKKLTNNKAPDWVLYLLTHILNKRPTNQLRPFVIKYCSFSVFLGTLPYTYRYITIAAKIINYLKLSYINEH